MAENNDPAPQDAKKAPEDEVEALNVHHTDAKDEIMEEVLGITNGTKDAPTTVAAAEDDEPIGADTPNGDGIQTEVYETLDDLKAQAETNATLDEAVMEESREPVEEEIIIEKEPVVEQKPLETAPEPKPKKGFWARLFGS